MNYPESGSDYHGGVSQVTEVLGFDVIRLDPHELLSGWTRDRRRWQILLTIKCISLSTMLPALSLYLAAQEGARSGRFFRCCPELGKTVEQFQRHKSCQD